MPQSTGQDKRSLLQLLGSIVIAVVVLVMGVHSTYLYFTQRAKMLDDIKSNAGLSLATLKKNITPLIEAYAVTEYGNLLATEIELRNHFAIIVEDRNMAKVLGKDSYVSGLIREPNGNVVEFDPDDKGMQRRIEGIRFRESLLLKNTSGSELVLCESSAASMMLPSTTSCSQLGM